MTAELVNTFGYITSHSKSLHMVVCYCYTMLASN